MRCKILQKINIIGAGLAGSEAAWQIIQQGIPVRLFEMRPIKMTPAHHTGLFSELVCSNSLRAANIENAVGLLKEEMRVLNSLIISCADANRVPAGGALAVDRTLFAENITKILSEHPLVEVVHTEVVAIPRDEITIIATGPLTDGDFAVRIQELLGEEYLHFFDAAAPIVTFESLDMGKVFRASRYDKGEAAYLNCPMSEEEYNNFYQELITAEPHEVKDFEKKYFEGCMPVEAMAERGIQTLLFGPMKPVGLPDPKTNQDAFAIVQLRQDNMEGTLYNLVGFQTRLKWGEQKRVFSMIPGLEQAEFARFGVMHKNTFINSPEVLKPTMQLKTDDRIFFAGQITGVEGYVESASNGLVAGINASRLYQGKELLIFPDETAHGALCNYITTAVAKTFQPMKITFGILPPLNKRIRNKKEKNTQIAQRAIDALKDFMSSNEWK